MKLPVLSVVLLLLPILADAEVNTRNGNFGISITDLQETSAEHKLELTRTYDSKATENGWFGVDWGSPFQTQLRVMPDGSVFVRENGTGSSSHYVPQDGSNVQVVVEKIVATATGRDKLTADAAGELRSKLLNDPNLRLAKVAEYGIQTILPVGGKALSNVCEDSAVIRIGDEYQRTSCKSLQKGLDYFDFTGRLVRQVKDGYALTIHYAGKHPDRIEDSLGRQIFLKWTNDGHIGEARSEPGKTTLRYDYDATGNLRLSSVTGDVFYRYEYDGSHRMTQIATLGDAKGDIQYDKDGRAVAVVDFDGSKNEYAYRPDPQRPSEHFWTTTTHTTAAGEKSSVEEEFTVTTDANGVEKVVRETDVEKREKQERLAQAEKEARLEHARVQEKLRACRTEYFENIREQHTLMEDLGDLNSSIDAVNQNHDQLDMEYSRVSDDAEREAYNERASEQNSRIAELKNAQDSLVTRQGLFKQKKAQFDENCGAIKAGEDDVTAVCGDNEDDLCTSWRRR